MRASPSASENFPIFLAELCARADAATLTPPTRALLNGNADADDPGAILFPSSQSLLDYATHRLLWSWYSRDRDARQGTQF